MRWRESTRRSGRGGSSATAGLGATAEYRGGRGATESAGGASGRNVSTGGGGAAGGGGAVGSGAVATRRFSTLATACESEHGQPRSFAAAPSERIRVRRHRARSRGNHDLAVDEASVLGNVPPPGGGDVSNEADAQPLSDLFVEAYPRSSPSRGLPPSPLRSGRDGVGGLRDSEASEPSERRHSGGRSRARWRATRICSPTAAAMAKAGSAEVIARMLPSPTFFIASSWGSPRRTPRCPLTSYELATRLSFFVWSSMPDQVLFAAADDNQLATVDQLKAQVARMLDNPRAHAMVAAPPRVAQPRQRSPGEHRTAVPGMEVPHSRGHLVTESETFVDNVFWSNSGLATLLARVPRRMNGNVAKHPLGVAAAGAAMFTRVNLARGGNLDSGRLPRRPDGPRGRRRTRRGLFVHSRLLCSAVPPPPPGVPLASPDIRCHGTAAHASHHRDPMCAACHRLFDPLGFAFETSTPFQKTVHERDSSLPIDASAARDPRQRSRTGRWS